MKFLLLVFLITTTGLYTAYAQGSDWFKGAWYGERTFPDARVAKKVLVRMEVEEMHNSLFSGRLIYMYPSDTTARLIRKVGGQLYSKYVIINKSEEIYRMDARSRSFWSDCSNCPGASSFSIEHGDLVLKIVTTGCADSCNGETTFRRKMNDYDSATQAVIIRQLAATGENEKPITDKTRKSDKLKAQLAAKRDSVKYFPHLLKNGMGIHFDPNKYTGLSPLTTDTASVATIAALNKIPKRTELPKNIAVKDSVVLNKNSNIANNKANATTPAKDSLTDKTITKETTVPVSKPQQKDTVAAAIKAPSKAPANAQSNTDAAVPKQTAASSAPAKDTVPAAIIQRATSLVTTYQISSPHITVQLLDDGQIDGDAVSVFYNGKVIINNQTLTHKAITFTLEASAANRHHEFILISESEGFLPPNTALMRIKAGSQQFELSVSSSSARNVKIAIDYTGE